MSVPLVRIAWWRLLAVALASCGASAGGSATASSPPSKPLVLPEVPMASEAAEGSETSDSSDQPSAAWARLLAEERISRRLELDTLCDADHAGFFVSRPPDDTAAPSIAPIALGCVPPTQPEANSRRLIEAPPEVLGATYCCPRTRSAPPPPAASGTSCGQAALDYTRHFGDASAVDDGMAESVAAVLNRGSYFAHCGVPDSASIFICVAVLEGHAEGVTVVTRPGSSIVDECIADSVRLLVFPSSPRMVVGQTRF